MKVTWGHHSCQRLGNPYYDKKRSGTFGYPRQQKNSHYAWLNNNIKQYTKKVFFLIYVLFCTTAKVITVYSYLEKIVRKSAHDNPERYSAG